MTYSLPWISSSRSWKVTSGACRLRWSSVLRTGFRWPWSQANRPNDTNDGTTWDRPTSQSGLALTCHRRPVSMPVGPIRPFWDMQLALVKKKLISRPIDSITTSSCYSCATFQFASFISRGLIALHLALLQSSMTIVGRFIGLHHDCCWVTCSCCGCLHAVAIHLINIAADHVEHRRALGRPKTGQPGTISPWSHPPRRSQYQPVGVAIRHAPWCWCATLAARGHIGRLGEPGSGTGDLSRPGPPGRFTGSKHGQTCLPSGCSGGSTTQSETEVPADVGPRRPRQVNKPGRGGQSQDLHGHLPCLGGGGFPFGQPEHQVFRGLLESGRVSQCRRIFSGHLWASAKGSQDTNSRHSQDGHPWLHSFNSERTRWESPQGCLQRFVVGQHCTNYGWGAFLVCERLTL